MLSRRTFPLEDIRINPDGDGRTVTAYAAVFDSPTPISDFEGDYIERIDPSAFNKAIKDAAHQGSRTGWLTSVLFNHGMTTYGTPSDRGSLPIGTPLDIRADARGLLTVTRYSRSTLADEVLESIKAGAITAQSFQGRFLRSDKKGPFRPDANGELTVVTRQEVTLKEYGPAVFAAYPDAEIIGVRHVTECPQCLAATRQDGVPTETSTSPEAAETEPLQEHLARWNNYRYQAKLRGILA